MIRLLCCPAVLLLLSACSPMSEHRMNTAQIPPLDERKFHITYNAMVKDLTPGKKLQVWIPIPQDDPHQTISNVNVSKTDGLAQSIRTEPTFGNTMLYLEGMTGDQTALNVTIDYDVTRKFNQMDVESVVADGPTDGTEFDVYRQPSSLCVVNDEIRTTAAKIGSEGTTLVRARAFYDHVAGDMEYDKSGTGWGLGSTVHACDVGRGNCTDFHSYFISLCLAENIAARFQIGLFGKYETLPGQPYETGGYHCWAEFRVPGRAWVPVDISEADKGKGDFFGQHTHNRVTLSTGRDVTLSPAQSGGALNYFLNPYAELDGRPHAGVSKKCIWLDE